MPIEIETRSVSLTPRFWGLRTRSYRQGTENRMVNLHLLLRVFSEVMVIHPPCHRRTAGSSPACCPQKGAPPKLKKICAGAGEGRMTIIFHNNQICLILTTANRKVKTFDFQIMKIIFKIQMVTLISWKWISSIQLIPPEQNAGYPFWNYWEKPGLSSYIGVFRILDITIYRRDFELCPKILRR